MFEPQDNGDHPSILIALVLIVIALGYTVFMLKDISKTLLNIYLSLNP